jgi:hypothetical protein
MIKVKIDGEELQINPELTVQKYQIIQRDPKRYENQTEILALYLGLTPDELKDLPVDQISFLDNLVSMHLTTPTGDIIHTFQHDGVTYGLENDFGNMTFGQWTDMEVFSQPDKINDNIHILLALLYRPVEKIKGNTYKLEKYKSSKVVERAEIFREIPVIIWFSAANFFFLISKEYVSNINLSLKRKMKIRKLKTKIMDLMMVRPLLNLLQDFSFNSLIPWRKKTSPK